MGVGVVLGDGMGAFVGAGVGVAEWVFVCLDINVGPDVLWMQFINKFWSGLKKNIDVVVGESVDICGLGMPAQTAISEQVGSQKGQSRLTIFVLEIKCTH